MPNGDYIRTEETKEKQRQAILGKHHSLETKEKIRQSEIGKKQPKEAIEKTRQYHLGKKRSQETKDKMSQSAIKRSKINNGSWPSYSIKACNFFELFDEKFDTKGKYALLGGGGYSIYPYFVDYINFDLKLIIEFDEKHHFNNDGKLNKKDVQRQQDIQKLYPEFEFFRFKENEQNLGV